MISLLLYARMELAPTLSESLRILPTRPTAKNSAQGKSGSVYAAKITLSKASDTYSTNGITAMTVNSASTYVMIAERAELQ